jgi:uncharacterized protein YndB with AHSA1/START domain
VEKKCEETDMNDIPAIRSVVVERELPHPPAKVWRALTQPHLIQEWLMQTDFAAEPGHKFQLRGDWGAVDCEVLTIEPDRELAYSWAAFGLESTVTWTLTPSEAGTRLRMEQRGFTPDQEYAYQGAGQAWPTFFDQLEKLLEQE